MKKFTLLLIILFCFTATGCGLTLRKASALPTELHKVYFSTEKPYSLLSVQLKELLRSMNVHLLKPTSGARFSIVISSDIFSHSLPDLVDTTLPTTINFSQSATISIEDNLHHTTIASQSFTTTQSITLNTNQIYTINANSLIHQQLTHEMISFIYYWLISTNIKDTLHHATRNQAARRAS